MNHNPEYSFKRLTKSLLPDLLVLIQNCYGRNDSLVRLEKKYSTIDFGAEYIGYVAYHRPTNKVAGYYGVFPIVCSFRGEKILLAQSGDTMTHSDHRRKGLFTSLAYETYRLARDNGIKGVFGFPVEASYPGFQRKLNWKFYERLNSYNIITKTIPVSETLKRISKYVKPNGYHKYVRKYLTSIATDQNPFIEDLAFSNYCKIHRDHKFYNYKNSERIFYVSYGNASAIIKFDGSFSIGNLKYSDVDDLKDILNYLKGIAFKLGITRLRTYVSPDDPLDIDLSKILKRRVSLPVGYLDFESSIPVEKLKFRFCDLDTF